VTVTESFLWSHYSFREYVVNANCVLRAGLTPANV
jgi:hypothetical protein